MKVISAAPWKNVKCSCGTGLEIELSDIKVRVDGHDWDEGEDILSPYVTCPVCHKNVSMYMKGVPYSTIKARRERDLQPDDDI